MKTNLAASTRGLTVGAVLLALGLTAAASRIITMNATTDSLFFISLIGTAGGAAIIVRIITIARRRTALAR